ncbi:MAG: PAS domain-containing sensor histidine kinase [Emcibacter sp.]|nr:PAS domain-containing sensor histidine kinase [Emcibacter sp.]
MLDNRVKYFLSFIILGILLTAIFVFVNINGESHTKFVQTIDVAGGQRKLSQEIISISNQLKLCDFEACGAPRLSSLRDDLRHTKNLFRRSFIGLKSGKLDEMELVPLDDDIVTRAGINTRILEDQMDIFLKSVDNIMSPDSDVRETAYKNINQFAGPLLVNLNLIVGAYAVKARDISELLRLSKILTLILLVGAISITAFLIFRPMEKNIHESHDVIKEQKNFMQTVIRSLPDPLLVVDAEGNIQIANEAAAKMFGWREKSLLKMNISVLLEGPERKNHEEMVRRFVNDFNHTEARAMSDARMVYMMTKTGEKVKVSITLGQYKSDGNNLGIAVIRDMSLQEQLIHALEDRVAASRIAEEAKEAFIRNISHELRTPLNAVIGFSDLLKIQLTKTENEGYAEDINSAGRQLLKDVNRLIDVASKEPTKEFSSLSHIKILDYIDQMKDVWAEQLADGGHRLIIDDIDPALSVEIDQAILSFVMKSVIENVVTHCSRGCEVKIGATEQEGRISLFVRDNGPGVPLGSLALIGHPFEKMGSGLTSVNGGLGLSLFLASQQIRSMGGAMSFYSEVGQGFEAKITLRSHSSHDLT